MAAFQVTTEDSTFISALYNRFKDRNDFTFLARGFRAQFVDTGSSPNQVRHAVGAITAGYLGGVAAIPGGPSTYPLTLKTTLAPFNEREKGYDSHTVHGLIGLEYRLLPTLEIEQRIRWRT